LQRSLLHKSKAIKRVQKEREKEAREMVICILLSLSIIDDFGSKNN
jgi:hypothetical protein